MQIINHHANSYKPPQGSPPSGTNPYEFRPQNPTPATPPAPQCPWEAPTETFTPSAPQSLGSATWNGAKKGACWGTIALGAVTLASGLASGQVEPQFLLEAGVGAVFTGSLVGGTVGAAIGAGKHLMAR